MLGMQSTTFIKMPEAARAAVLQRLVGQRFLATVYPSSKTISMQLCRFLKV